MKKIFASNKKNAYAKVDDDVFETIQNMGLKFSIRNDDYFQSTTNIQLPCMMKKKQLQLHVFVWILKTGEKPMSSLDHIDRNPANNMFSNLRLATIQEQNQHRGRQKSNTSGFIGVCHINNKHYKNRYRDYWRAQIRKPDGKLKVKYFDYDDKGLLEAARWRDQKAIEYFGEFHGQLNFPDENK